MTGLPSPKSYKVDLDPEVHAMLKAHCKRHNVRAKTYVSALILQGLGVIPGPRREDHTAIIDDLKKELEWAQEIYGRSQERLKNCKRELAELNTPSHQQGPDNGEENQ